MIDRILNSDKIKRLILSIKNIPYLFLDFLLISFAVFNNLIKYKKLYKKEMQIVTASDNIFFESLCQLIRNLKKYEEDIQIIIYDIGLEREQKSKLLTEFKDIKYKEFNFSNYPVFIGKRDEYKKLGHYAWKSIIIHKELTESKNQILWFDTGNLITKKLTLLRIVLTAYGIFSPISNGTIKEWTHIETLKYLQVSKSIQNKRNLTGGIIGFDWSNHYARKIAEDWKKYSTKKECIAPPGSDRGNHRQDQSIFSILKYKEKNIKAIPKNKKLFGLRVNQNPGIKIYLSDSYKNKKRKNLKEEWLKENFEISTNTIKASNIVWILDIEDINKIPKKILNQNEVILMVDKDYFSSTTRGLTIFENKKEYIDYFAIKNNEKDYILSQGTFNNEMIISYQDLPELKNKIVSLVSNN